ncbi:MAG: fumarate hydratase [Nitrospirae bacterium]|nr:MAG: fumarate hydratase [Nitrospirota bacterium]
MLKLRDGIVELYKKVATSIPRDVEDALKKALQEETGPLAKNSLEIILRNISIARNSAVPICQDTGFPVFYVKVPIGLSHELLRNVIVEATRLATQKIPLRANAVDTVTEKNSGDNTGELFPLIHIESTTDQALTIDLMLKGGGSENIGQIYKLPATLDTGGQNIRVERDLEGVRKCVLDAVFKAQGRGCPPYTVTVAIGGAKDQVTALSKKQLLRKLNDAGPVPAITEFEKRLLDDINNLGIGAAGLGGRTTAIGVKVAAAHRHPASYFVDVSFACWANRRGRFIW